MAESFLENQMLAALKALDSKLSRSVRLIVGGGGAIILTHLFPLATTDIDAVPGAGTTPEELDPLIKEVAKELGLPTDWLNPYYSTFTHVLPSDYGNRLIQVAQYSRLCVLALSKDDLLIMKCFAARMKDRAHSIALIRAGADTRRVELHIESLIRKKIPNAEKAMDFLDEVSEIAQEAGRE
jgi:hypothetical protein